MLSADQYRSTEKGYTNVCYSSENIIFSNLNSTEIVLSILDHFQAIQIL